MNNPIDPTLARQGRLGRQVLVILVASLALAFISAWVLWGAVASASDAEMAFSRNHYVGSPEPATDQAAAETPIE